MSGARPTVGPAAADALAWLDQEAQAADAALDAVVAERCAAIAGSLGGAIRYALGTRGKRLRPVLCAVAYQAIGCGPAADARRYACAVEIIHTYSLVHDDLPCMDDDEMRRGRATVHRVYGSRLATLAGAALIPLALEVLDAEAATLGLSVAERAHAATELCAAAGAGGMIAGQWMDLAAEGQPVHRAQLEAIHRRKTGALLAASLRLGGIAARATPDQIRALSAYGEAIGLAFQIADDILDVTGESAELGKVAGRDATLGKATYPALFGLDSARALARARAEEAVAVLTDAEIHAPALEALAWYVIERPR